MGIVNMTPDSFSGDGFGTQIDAARDHAWAMVEAGADIVDVGGESTRPGAAPVSMEEEINRVIPLIKTLARDLPVPVSIDTRKATVAQAAFDAGASIANDIWGLQGDSAMAAVVAEYQPVGVIAMHNHDGVEYRDLMADVRAFLAKSLQTAGEAGIASGQVVVDPGFGFGKTPAHNLELVRNLASLKDLDQPILVGPSNKSTLGIVLGGAPIQDRAEASLAVAVLAIANGADIVRVHDVRAMSRARALVDPIVRGISTDIQALTPPGHTL